MVESAANIYESTTKIELLEMNPRDPANDDANTLLTNIITESAAY